MSVHPSAWNNSAPTGRILMKFYIWGFFENRTTGTLLEDSTRSPFLTWLSRRSQSGRWSCFGKRLWFTESNIECVPLATEPAISLIILTPMKILQRNLNRSTFVVWEMKRNVSVVCVCSASNCRDTEQRSASQPGSVASGTHSISCSRTTLGWFMGLHHATKIFSTISLLFSGRTLELTVIKLHIVLRSVKNRNYSHANS